MTKFPVSDGTIEKIVCERERLFLEFLDWQEQLWVVTFENVLGFKSLGAVDSEVSEMYEVDATILSEEIALVDASDTGKNFCFISARGSDVVLTIVASSYMAERITSK